MAAAQRFLALAALLAWPFLAVLVGPAGADCYAPDREPFYDHQVCDSPFVGLTTACCRTLDVCLDNLLCGHTDDHGHETFYRGSCAGDWSEADRCPAFCMGETVEDSHLGEWPVGKCPADGASIDRWFCIGSEPGFGTVEDCSDPSFGFALNGDTRPFWTAGITPTYTQSPAQTKTIPGTSTVLSWKGTGKSTLRASLPLSTPDRPPTSSETAITSSSASSMKMDTTSFRLDSTISLSEDPVSWTSIDLPLTTPLEPVDSQTPTQDIDTTITSPSPDRTIITTQMSPLSPNPTPTTSDDATDSDVSGTDVAAVIVTVTVGTFVVVALTLLVLLCVRDRRRNTPARAETPPPYEEPDMIPLADLPPPPPPPPPPAYEGHRSGLEVQTRCFAC